MSSPSLLSRASIVCLLGSAMLVAGCDRKSPAPEQANAAGSAVGPAAGNTATSDEVAPSPDEATGTPAAPVEKIDRSHKGETGPAISFTAPDGKAVTLASFKGKPLLLNLWATWCAPCVAEMPTLDAVAGSLKGKVQVVAVSQDLQGADKVTPFFAQKAFTTLQPYLDTKAALSIAYQANLPTTILYDSDGREVWRMLGGYEWNAPAAAKLIAEAR